MLFSCNLLILSATCVCLLGTTTCRGVVLFPTECVCLKHLFFDLTRLSYSYHEHMTNFTIQQSRSFEGVCVPLRLMNCLFPVPDSQPTATELVQSPLYGSGTVFRSTPHLLRHFLSCLVTALRPCNGFLRPCNGFAVLRRVRNCRV